MDKKPRFQREKIILVLGLLLMAASFFVPKEKAHEDVPEIVQKVVRPVGVPEAPSAVLEYSSTGQLMLNIKWSPVAEAAGYELEIAGDVILEDGKQTYSVRDNNFTIDNISQPKVFYRIRALAAGRDGDFTPVNEASLSPLSPPQLKSAVLKKSKGSFKLSLQWEGVENSTLYRLEVSEDPTFQNPVNAMTVEKEFEIGDLRARQVFARIRSENNYLTGDYGSPFQVTYVAPKPPRKPAAIEKQLVKPAALLATPLVDEKLKVMDLFFQKGAGRFVWLKWNTAQPADSLFHVEFSADPEFKTVQHRYSVKDTKVLLRSELQKGTYYWRVREQNFSDFSDWSETYVIRVLTSE